MGFFDAEYDVGMAEGNVRNCQQILDAKKEDRESAKRVGNYKNATKNYRYGDNKVGNVYDYNVWVAQENLKNAQKRLADAKARAKKEKNSKKSSKSSGDSSSSRSSSSSSAREDVEARARIEEEARQAKIRKQVDEMFEQYREAFDKEYSLKNASESKLIELIPILKQERLRVKREYEKHEGEEVADRVFGKCMDYLENAIEEAINRVVKSHTEPYKSQLESKYPVGGMSVLELIELAQEIQRLNEEYKANNDDIQGEIILGYKRVVKEHCDAIVDIYASRELEKYKNELSGKFPVGTATAKELADLLPMIEAEINRMNELCKSESNDPVSREVDSRCKNAVQELGVSACDRLRKLSPILFNQRKNLEIAKRIDPRLNNPIALATLPVTDALGSTVKMTTASFESMSKMIKSPFEWFNKIMSKLFKF